MINREKQISEAAKMTFQYKGDNNVTTGILTSIYGFLLGARWADNHPSDETISKILNLYTEYRSSDDEPEEWGTNAKEACYNFIREHWEEIK